MPRPPGDGYCSAMHLADSTCWELLGSAADGDANARTQFVAAYGPMVRGSLEALWRGTPHLAHLDDAIQDVFVECLKPNGVLRKADRSRPSGFRAFLRGVVRSVASRHQFHSAREAGRKSAATLDGIGGGDDSVSRILDREWARTIVRAAGERMRERARQLGPSAEQRVELLRERYDDDVPVRDIARRLQLDPDVLHHQLAKARAEFREMLLEVVAVHYPGTRASVERECRRLLDLLD